MSTENNSIWEGFESEFFGGGGGESLSETEPVSHGANAAPAGDDAGIRKHENSGRIKEIHSVPTEDAGLSDKAAGEIAGYFDEMIGWRAVARPQAKQNSAPWTGQQDTGEKAPGSDEIDRRKQKATAQPEIDRSKQRSTPRPQAVSKDTVPAELLACAIPEREREGFIDYFALIVVSLLGGILLFVILGPVAILVASLVGMLFHVQQAIQASFEQIAYILYIASAIYLFRYGVRYRKARAQFRVTRSGDQLCLTWPEKYVRKQKWGVAVNGKWVKYGELPSGVCVTCKGSAHVVMADVTEKKAPKAWKASWFSDADV